MIRLRLSAFSHETSDKDISFIEKELLSDLVSRCLKDNGIEGREELFQVLVNGHLVEKEYWPVVEVKETDSVMIAPIIKGGTFGEIFKTIAVIVVAVVASAYTGGAAGGIGGALLTAGAAIGTSLLLNALIPPPVPGGFDVGGGASSFESSQMYAITSQSNSVKKFGTVPKVYGTHRIFPPIAANPYTEVEADPSTGDLVQFFYCVYDLGFGPAQVTDIRIGDTPISDFADASFRLVDFNKPAVSEGPWDDVVGNDLEFYKGDSEIESLGLFIDANQESGGALEDYQIVRNAAPNPEGSKQEIILTFINPQGLIAYGTQGETYERSIDLDVEYQKVGETVWHKYNSEYSTEYRAVGGELSMYEVVLEELPFAEAAPYVKFSSTPEIYFDYSSFYWVDVNPSPFPPGSQIYYHSETWGYPTGVLEMVIKAGTVSVGQSLFFNGEFVGLVRSISSYTPNPTYVRVRFFQPTRKAFTFFEVDIQEARQQQYVYNIYTGYYEAQWTTVVRTVTIAKDYTNTFITKLPGKFIIKRKETGQVYTTVRFTPREIGEYRVRVTRLRSYSTGNFQVQDRLALASITTRFDRKPIVTDKRHLFLELRVRATNQLNGAIQNISGVVTSVLDVWNGTQWVKQPTSNPAWVYADLLTGEVNKRAISKNRLHTESLLEWAQFCDQIPTPPPTESFIKPRFECNFVLDFETTLQSILNQVANAAQASLNLVDGKYGVLVDKKRTVPVQIFTPRNSRDFSSSKAFYEPPHSVKVRYIDPASSWELKEEIVYADGYDVNTAITADELTSFACTNPEQAWRFGRYMMAQAKLRQETISITVDYEFLVCNRGDYVQITQDVMKVGGTPARVKSVSGNTIVINDSITTAVGINYGYVARTMNGIVTNTLTVVNSDTFQLNGIIPGVGDLIVIGEVGKIVYDCIVKSIAPNDDLTARLVLIEKADAVYDAESLALLPNYSPQISITVNSDVAPPAVENMSVLENSYLCGANSFEHYIKVDWDLPVGAAFEYFEVFVDDGRGYDIAGTTRDSEFTYFVDNERLGFLHQFKILAVSSTGKKIELIAAPVLGATPVKKTTRPMNVASLSTNITGEVLQLDWEAVNDCIREYLVRYSPTLTGTWEASIPLLRTDKNTTLASTQARTGTYLIKAIDFNDNESETATVAITTIPELFNLNVIDEITDAPDWLGAKDRVVKFGTDLMLRNKEVGGAVSNEYYPEGYYYYKEFLDLGEIFTVRLQSLIQAEGYTVEDLMANWATLSSVIALSNARYSEWDVQSEYRTTDSFNVMADWVTMSAVDPISEGVQDNWTPWRRFTMGDGTGRIFQFRLKLISNKASVTPKVFDGTIKADVPDRYERYDNLVADSVEGYTVNYTPHFMGPGTTPNVQITIDNGQSGDYWVFEYKTLSGFKIKFYDKDGIQVSRTFDAQINGYGRKATYVI